jgi:hypothetical protein
MTLYLPSMQYVMSPIRDCVNWLLRLAVAFLLVASPISSHATLYVLVVGRGQIAIAADSRLVTVTGTQIATADGIQKVISLGSKIAFMSAGVGEISTGNVTIMPGPVAKECYSSMAKNGRRVRIIELADTFGKTITDRLDRLSASAKAQIYSSIVQQFGSQDNQVMESTFVGVNDAGQLLIETLNVRLVPPSSANENAKFEWTRHETPGDRPNIILSGEVGVLRNAFENAESPIAQLSSFQAWRQAFTEGRPVSAAQTAEALVNLAIKYSPPDQAKLGYPIFVYTLDAQNGLTKLRTVPKGKAAVLPH